MDRCQFDFHQSLLVKYTDEVREGGGSRESLLYEAILPEELLHDSTFVRVP